MEQMGKPKVQIGRLTSRAAMILFLCGCARAVAAPSSTSAEKLRAALQRDSERLAVPVAEIVAFITLGAKDDMSADDVERGIFETGKTAHEAKYGPNNEAAAAAAQIGLQLEFQDERPLLGKYLLDLADAVSRQKDPYTRAKICEYLGCDQILPVLQRGRPEIQQAIDSAVARGIR